MKKNLLSLFKACSLILLVTAATSCKKNKTTEPVPEVKTNLTGTIDGKPITIDQSNLASTYYSSDSDPVKSLATTATLNAAGDKLAFFISDLKSGSITLTKKLGTSLNPGTPGLRINDTGPTTATIVQSYCQYISGGNVYYAYSGTFEVTFTPTLITVKWTINFKDGTGREFTSTGSYTIVNYTTVTQPKTAVVDPTPVSVAPRIESIAPTQGMANDTVTITGLNYSTTPAEDVVKFNGIDATVISATATSIKVKAPATGTTGPVSVKVKNSDVTSGPTFTYLVPATITSFSPLSAYVGETVTITGTNFSTVLTENAVKFHGTAAVVKTATTTQLTVEVPQGATTGGITLSVKGRALITTSEFIVNVAPQGTSLNWTDVGFTPTIGDLNMSAVKDSIMLFTGGLLPNYIYRTVNGIGYTNVYFNLPFNTSGLQIHLLVSSGNAFYITTNYGVAKSVDGSTWFKLTPEPNSPDLGFTGIIAKGQNVTLINGAKLYTSSDGGVTYAVNAVTSPGTSTMDYIASDSNGKYYYAVDVSNNLINTSPKTFYHSTNQGKTWTATTGNTGYYFYGIGNQDFLSASSGTTYILFQPPAATGNYTLQRIYKSTSQGDSWTKLSDELVNAIKVSGTTVMYGGVSFFVSTDNGGTFTQYLAPTGYVIGGMEKCNGYYYLFCYKTGSQQHKIFRAPVQ